MTLDYVEVSSTIMYFQWLEPDGLYDSMDLTVRLIGTTSASYFTNKSATYTECQIGTTYKLENITKNQSNGNIAAQVEIQNTMFKKVFLNVCPMSNFNASIKIKRSGFLTVETFILIKTSNLC